MSGESSSTSGYMGAFQDFVQGKLPGEESVSGQRSRPSTCPVEPAAASSEVESEAAQATDESGDNKQSTSGAKPGKRCRPSSDESDDDDDDTETDVADDKASSTESEHTEPPAVPKRPRTQRSAKQKLMNSRGGRGSSSAFCNRLCGMTVISACWVNKKTGQLRRQLQEKSEMKWNTHV